MLYRDQIGQRLNGVDTSVYIQFNDEGIGHISTDIFNLIDAPYDPAPFQDREYARVSVPLFGSGYNFVVYTLQLLSLYLSILLPKLGGENETREGKWQSRLGLEYYGGKQLIKCLYPHHKLMNMY